MASAPPDGQLRAAHQATDETHRDRGCGRKGQRSHAGEGKGEWETYMAAKYGDSETGAGRRRYNSAPQFKDHCFVLKLIFWTIILISSWNLSTAASCPRCLSIAGHFWARGSVRVLAVVSGSVGFTREFCCRPVKDIGNVCHSFSVVLLLHPCGTMLLVARWWSAN